MKSFVTLSVVAAVMFFAAGTQAAEKPSKDKAPAKVSDKKVPEVLNFTMKTLAGEKVDLKKYNGKVVMIVNVASRCGLTPQYKQLQTLHSAYHDKGLEILAFPCNQFGRQEPGTSTEIREFCTTKYGVKFDMFAKVDVNGEEQCSLYKYLTNLQTKPAGKGNISWNFEKFLIGRDGKVLARFAPRTKPDAPEVMKIIKAELAKK